MTTEKIIAQGDKILTSDFDFDKRIYKRLSLFLSKNSIGGKVSITKEDLAQIEDLIYKEIKDSNYEENISNYLRLFVAIENSVSQQQAEYNRIKSQAIKDLWNSVDKKTFFMDKIVGDLGKSGIQEVFTKGISAVIRDATYFNLTIEDATARLSKVLIDDEYTKRYVKGVAMDSLAHYAGAINDALRVAYDLEDILYIGNVIETSRPICDHLAGDLKGRVTSEKLKEALKKYCPNGEPSKTKTTYTTINGVEINAQLGSGMMQGTTFENFGQMRGGHQCRHEAIWVRKFK